MHTHFNKCMLVILCLIYLGCIEQYLNASFNTFAAHLDHRIIIILHVHWIQTVPNRHSRGGRSITRSYAW